MARRSRLAIPLHVTPHASSPPNHPTRSVRMQTPPRASRDMIAARAPIHFLPFAYGIPHVLSPRPPSQISPHTKRAAHILPSECAARCHGRTRSARGAQQPLLRFITRYRAPYGRARIPPAARSSLQSYPSKPTRRKSTPRASHRGTTRRIVMAGRAPRGAFSSPPPRPIARYGAPDHALLIIHRTSMPARQSAPPSSARTTYLSRKLPLPSGNALSP